jgi:hypothetical protein
MYYNTPEIIFCTAILISGLAISLHYWYNELYKKKK